MKTSIVGHNLTQHSESRNIDPRQLVVFSSAAGSNGSVVVELAKCAFGAKKAVEITCSDERCKQAESPRVDESVNHEDSKYKRLSYIFGSNYVCLCFVKADGAILSLMIKTLGN